MFWQPSTAPAPDSHHAFRGAFALAARQRVALHLAGASWYGVRVDGRLIAHGPARFVHGRPEEDGVELELDAGSHLVAIHLHHDGVETRMLREQPPFLACRIVAAAGPVAVAWRERVLAGWRAG